MTNEILINISLTFWLKHILLVNTKGLGMAKLRRKPSPKPYVLADSVIKFAIPWTITEMTYHHAQYLLRLISREKAQELVLFMVQRQKGQTV